MLTNEKDQKLCFLCSEEADIRDGNDLKINGNIWMVARC